jgi:hypothetical protein
VKALALGLALAGCATAQPAPAPVSPQGACEISGLSGLVGQPATAELGAEAMRLSGATRLRWIRPGDMVTMDYSPQRLNIHLDAQNRVDRFACG